MRVKQYKGKVFGADLTAKERLAMNIEINRQIVEADRKYTNDIDAMVLYTLMFILVSVRSDLGGFGKRFSRSIKPSLSIIKCPMMAHGFVREN